MKKNLGISFRYAAIKKSCLFSALILPLITFSNPVVAEYGAALGYGLNSSMKGYRFSFQKSSCFYAYNGCIPLQGYWEGSMTHIRGRFQSNDSSNITGGSLSHVFRYEHRSKFTITTPYLEAGIGGVFYDKKTIVGRRLGSPLLLEIKLGAGLRFNLNKCWDYDIGYKFLHNSTAYLGSNSNAINMHFFMLNFWFK